jgi:hypothetical protein
MLGYLRRRNHTLWLRIFPLRLACTRKSHPADYHSLQPDRTQRSTLLQRLPPSSSFRACLALPSIVHGSRVSTQDRLHDILASAVPLRL